MLNKKITELSLENDQLKDEITVMESEKKNNDTRVLRLKIEELKDVIKQKDLAYDPEKIIDHQNIIIELDKRNKEKDILIKEYQQKLEAYLKNNSGFINIDEKEFVNSVSKVLNQKDVVIEKLKKKIVDVQFNTGGTDNNGNNVIADSNNNNQN